MSTLEHPIIAVITIVAATSIVVRTLLCAVVLAHARRRVPALRAAPGISVLKPLRGGDDGLRDNLRSLLRQDYPGPFELVLGASDFADPALVVARALAREFPEHRIRVVLTDPGAAANPKVANLIGLAAVARHPLLLVNDANVRVGPTYLRAMAAELQSPGVGLVGNLIAGTDDEGLGAILENLQINGFTAAGVCGAELGGHPCVIGKSLLMRRCDLDAVGGLPALGRVLGEDYVLGQAFARAGLGVRISSHVVAARSAGWSMRRFVERHLRWCQMRRWIAPCAYVIEPVLSPCPWLLAVVVAAACTEDPGDAALALAALGGVVWLAGLEAVQARALRGAWPPALYLAAVPLKELMMLGIWACAWVRREVVWRGRPHRIGAGSVLSPALRPTAAPHRCAPPLRPTAAPHRCAPPLRHTAAPHRCAPPLRHTAAPHRCATDVPAERRPRHGRDACDIRMIPCHGCTRPAVSPS